MVLAHALPGLPPYGPAALSFPRADAFSEGFVVQFAPDHSDTWVGNFAKWGHGRTSIHTELGQNAIFIAAAGAGYLVDAEARSVRDVGVAIQQVRFVEEISAIVVSNGLWFEAFGEKASKWRSRRISWDGMREIAFSAKTVSGEAYDPMTDSWMPFRLNLLNGEAEGGSYNGP